MPPAVDIHLRPEGIRWGPRRSLLPVREGIQEPLAARGTRRVDGIQRTAGSPLRPAGLLLPEAVGSLRHLMYSNKTFLNMVLRVTTLTRQNVSCCEVMQHQKHVIRSN